MSVSISTIRLLRDGPPGVSAPLHIPSEEALRLSVSSSPATASSLKDACVPWGCRNKAPHIGGLKAAEVSPLMVWRPDVQIQVWAGCPKGSEPAPAPGLLPASGKTQVLSARWQSSPPCVSTTSPLCVCAQMSSFIRTPVALGQGPA